MEYKMSRKKTSEALVKDIKRKTRKKYSSEEKIRIILDGLKGETTIAELCRREGINPNVYYNWSRDFLEAGKSRLQGDTLREANTNEVTEIRKENSQLKELVAELSLKNRVLKKSYDGLEKGSEESLTR
jgi:transposase